MRFLLLWWSDKIIYRTDAAGCDAGGDNRCEEQRCNKCLYYFYKDDSARKPFLDLNTFGQHKGGPNAVVLLRKRYDKWKKNQ